MDKARRHELILKRYEELCHYNSTTAIALYISKWATHWNTYHYSFLSAPPACFLSPNSFCFFQFFFYFFILFIHLFIRLFFWLTCYKYVMEARSKILPKENVSFLSTPPSPLFFAHLQSISLVLYIILFYLIIVVICLIY